MTRSLIDPRMIRRLTPSFFPHNVGFQRDTSIVQDGSGQMVSAWMDIFGFRQVPCRISPISNAQERKMAQFTVTDADSVILLAGAYEDVLTTKTRLVGTDGRIFDVLAVEVDSAHATTRVLAREHVEETP